MKAIDLSGQRFGKLTVLHRQRIRYGAYGWLCRCDCGNEKAIVTNSLTSGLSRSCGCTRVSPFARHPGRYNRKPADLTGKKFGRLTVIEAAGKKKGHLLWKCRCICGKERIVTGNNLRRRNTTSCGCQRRENAKTLLAPGIKPTYERFCRRCGEKFLATARQIYHSKECANYHEPAMAHCGVCGKLCPAKDGRRYCDEECHAVARQQHAAARVAQNRFRKVAELGAELDRRLNQTTEKPDE